MEHPVTYYKAKIFPRNPAANAALHIVDNSREYGALVFIRR